MLLEQIIAKKIKSLEKLIDGSSSNRYILDRRTIGVYLDEAYYLDIDSLSKKKE
jgi:hypothetical protein